MSDIDGRPCVSAIAKRESADWLARQLCDRGIQATVVPVRSAVIDGAMVWLVKVPEGDQHHACIIADEFLARGHLAERPDGSYQVVA